MITSKVKAIELRAGDVIVQDEPKDGRLLLTVSKVDGSGTATDRGRVHVTARDQGGEVRRMTNVDPAKRFDVLMA